VGVVIQAYLHRSLEDVRSLVKSKANIRLCKGIYVESSSVAIKDRQGIRDNYLKLLRLAFEGGSYAGIATHDQDLIEASFSIIGEYGLTKTQYEFQMLLGVREVARNAIVEAGHRLRVYVPYGKQWYAYSIRRLKENPAMAGYITKAMFGMK
jgi:proline dehydrogenase